MHYLTFNHRSTRWLGGMHNLVLRLPVRPYLGLVRKVSSPPIFSLISITFGFLPLGLFWFKSSIQNTLEFQRNLEDPAMFLRGPLSIFDVQCFLEEAPKFPVTFLSFSIPRNLLKFFSSAWYTNYIGGLLYCYRVDIFLCSCMAGFFGL